MLSCTAGRSQNDAATCFEISEHIVSWLPDELTLQALTINTPEFDIRRLSIFFASASHIRSIAEAYLRSG